VALSTTESNLIVRNKGIRTAIPLITLIEEIIEKSIGKFDSETKVSCKLFEDNVRALTIATLPRIRPRTKCLSTDTYVTRKSIHSCGINSSPVGQFIDKVSGREGTESMKDEMVEE